MDAVTGMPAGIFQENRFMTDLRTGAAGGLALKHCAVAKDALASAMHCLAHGDGEVVALPDVKRYIPVDQLRGEGEEEEELCDVESFSNIESALHQVRLTKDECL